jgi:transposase
VPKPFPREFREDVVRVARNRDPGQTLKQIAADFGISESCLTGWVRAADVEEGAKPGLTSDQAAELRELRRRNRLLEQENEVLRRAAAAATVLRWFEAVGTPPSAADPAAGVTAAWKAGLSGDEATLAAHLATLDECRDYGPLPDGTRSVESVTSHRVV